MGHIAYAAKRLMPIRANHRWFVDYILAGELFAVCHIDSATGKLLTQKTAHSVCTLMNKREQNKPDYRRGYFMVRSEVNK